MAQIRVGVSGWTYPPRRGNFYPKGLTQKLELAYASRRFNALEINGTFYSLQRPSSFQAWYEDTPPHFMFALSEYTPREISAWAAKVRKWHEGGEPEAVRRIGGKAKPAKKGG